MTSITGHRDDSVGGDTVSVDSGLPRLAKIAGAATFAVLVAGAMYLWVVRGEVLFIDGVLAAFCL